MLRRLVGYVLAAALLAGSVPAHDASTEAERFAAMVSERIAADLEEGRLDAPRELAEALEQGLVPDAGLATRLAGLAREALRSAALEDAGARTLVERFSRPLPAPDLAPTPADPLEFPRDEGAHGKLTEWWYWVGHLKTQDGARFGFQICFFRTRVGLHFIHCAVTDEATGRFQHRRTFVAPGSITAAEDLLHLVYGEARAEGRADLGTRLRFPVGDYAVDLSLTPTREPMLVNGDGVIDMPEGTDSRYYSRTALAAQGTVTREGQAQSVTGQVWFDHQWGNFICLLRPWDWFCIQLEDGTAYNLFSFRKALGAPTRSHVNVLAADGSLQVGTALDIRRERWWRSPKSGNWYVTDWTLALPERGETLRITATLEDQEMPRKNLLDIPPSYWEGSCTAVRTGADGSVVRGRSYAEHFDYAEPWPRADR